MAFLAAGGLPQIVAKHVISFAVSKTMNFAGSRALEQLMKVSTGDKELERLLLTVEPKLRLVHMVLEALAITPSLGGNPVLEMTYDVLESSYRELEELAAQHQRRRVQHAQEVSRRKAACSVAGRERL